MLVGAEISWTCVPFPSSVRVHVLRNLGVVRCAGKQRDLPKGLKVSEKKGLTVM